MICRRYFVSGRVQGVFFRIGVRQQAMLLDMHGWVRNRRDGRVEVFAAGTDLQHRALINWLKIGPSQAKVTTIEEIDEAMGAIPEHFEIRSTK
jgi:acylphosphatase